MTRVEREFASGRTIVAPALPAARLRARRRLVLGAGAASPAWRRGPAGCLRCDERGCRAGCRCIPHSGLQPAAGYVRSTRAPAYARQDPWPGCDAQDQVVPPRRGVGTTPRRPRREHRLEGLQARQRESSEAAEHGADEGRRSTPSRVSSWCTMWTRSSAVSLRPRNGSTPTSTSASECAAATQLPARRAGTSSARLPKIASNPYSAASASSPG